MASEATTVYDYSAFTGVDDVEPCRLDPSPAEVAVQTYVHSFICALGLIGNALVIVTYAFYKRTKTMTDVYLFNVALADLAFVAALPFIVHNEQHGWLMGAGACKALRSAYSINLYAGMLLLACISGDRYVAIVRARRSFGARPKTLVYSRLVCSVVWASAAVLTLPTLVYTERYEETDLLGGVSVTCQLSFDDGGPARLMKVLVPSLQVSVGFLLPLVIMVFCYSGIVRTLLRTRGGQRHKAVRVVMAVVVVFLVCHLPYNAALLAHTLSLFTQRNCEAEKAKLQLLAAFRSVAYLHCCLNPILYAFVGVKFRSHFRQIVLDLWCFGKKHLYGARASRATSDICVSGFKVSDGCNNISSFSA